MKDFMVTHASNLNQRTDSYLGAEMENKLTGVRTQLKADARLELISGILIPASLHEPKTNHPNKLCIQSIFTDE